MFQNNNKIVVKQFAKRDLHANRRRNIMAVITIALAVALMMVTALIPAGISQKQKNEEKGTAQVIFRNVTDRTVRSLKNAPDVAWAGEACSIGSPKGNDAALTVVYCDAAVLKASQLNLRGTLPQKSNEILVEPSFLSHIGSKAEPGDVLTLDLGTGGKREYRITGLIDRQMGDTGKYIAVVPKALIQERQDADTFSYNAYIGVKDADSLTETELKQKICAIAAREHIPQSDVSVTTSRYRSLQDNLAANAAGDIVIVAIILLAAAIVIYCIFYISVAGKVRQYGQLRTIGMTRKQIRKMVRREGIYLSAAGIPIGLIVGGLTGYIIIPKGWNWIITLLATIIVSSLGLLFVMASIRTPVRMAADVSPMEAVRYSACQGEIRQKKSRKLHRKITPLRLASENFMRNRKRSVLTLLSLGFSGILLVCVASISGSYAPELEAKRDFPYGEYTIFINGDSDTFSDGRIQRNNPLNQTLKDKIMKIDGVSEVKEWSGIRIKYTMPNHVDDTGTIAGFSRDEIGRMKPYLTDGTLDYDALTAKAGIAVCAPGIFEEAYGWSPELGDRITITALNSRGEKIQKTLTVSAFLSDNYRSSSIRFWMPVDTMHAITGMNCNCEFEIVTEKQKTDAVGESLRKLVDTNADLELDSLQQQILSYNAANRPVYLAFYILILFIALFGIINLLNTMVTNLLARSQEIGILQAVGLSGKQLGQMLRAEGLFYTAGATAMTLTFGTAAGYIACMVIKRLGMAIHYRFPVLAVCIFIAALFFVQLFLSLFSAKNLKKQPLVERISQNESFR
jgi:putative ABC transport system permease protein